MLRKLLLSAVCVLAVTACDKTVDGVLSNTENLIFNVKNKTATIVPGKWASQIEFESKKEVKLHIQTPNEKKPTTISFKVPKGMTLPQENGEFQLLSAQSGQPYDVNGSVTTTHKDSSEQWGWESCTYRVERQECYYDANGRPYCRWVYYDVHGQRNVRFFVRDTKQVLGFELLNATAASAGTFTGTKNSTQRIYSYTGQCR